jgi:hypothetical protein
MSEGLMRDYWIVENDEEVEMPYLPVLRAIARISLSVWSLLEAFPPPPTTRFWLVCLVPNTEFVVVKVTVKVPEYGKS